MANLTKPLPTITDMNRPYFDGARLEILRLQRCRACNAVVFFPREACPKCLSTETLEWFDANGTGNVFSFCIVHRPHHEAFYEDLPIVFAAIRLTEGPIILSEIYGADPNDIKIGQSVNVAFQKISEDISLPVWTLH